MGKPAYRRQARDDKNKHPRSASCAAADEVLAITGRKSIPPRVSVNQVPSRRVILRYDKRNQTHVTEKFEHAQDGQASCSRGLRAIRVALRSLRRRQHL